jgi:hypothetical protein
MLMESYASKGVVCKIPKGKLKIVNMKSTNKYIFSTFFGGGGEDSGSQVIMWLSFALRKSRVLVVVALNHEYLKSRSLKVM